MGLSIPFPSLFFFFRWLDEGRFSKTENSSKVNKQRKKVDVTNMLLILLLPLLSVRHVREERLFGEC